MLRSIFLLTLLSLFPRRAVLAWAPEARLPVRDFGAFLDFDDMFDLRSPPDLGQVFLPTFNPLTHSHRMVSPLHTSSKADEAKRLQEPRHHLPGYSVPDIMQGLHDAKARHDNHVMKLFFNKKNLLPDTADVFGRDEKAADVRITAKLHELQEHLEDFQPPSDDRMDLHTKRLYFEPKHKLPDKHYGSDLE